MRPQRAWRQDLTGLGCPQTALNLVLSLEMRAEQYGWHFIFFNKDGVVPKTTLRQKRQIRTSKKMRRRGGEQAGPGSESRLQVRHA